MIVSKEDFILGVGFLVCISHSVYFGSLVSCKINSTVTLSLSSLLSNGV